MAWREPAKSPPVIVAVNAVSDLGIMCMGSVMAAAVVDVDFVEMKDVICLVLDSNS